MVGDWWWEVGDGSWVVGGGRWEVGGRQSNPAADANFGKWTTTLSDHSLCSAVTTKSANGTMRASIDTSCFPYVENRAETVHSSKVEGQNNR